MGGLLGEAYGPNDVIEETNKLDANHVTRDIEKTSVEGNDENERSKQQHRDHNMHLKEAKVIIPLHQLKAVNPSISRAKPAEKYIQVISVDNHEFWFMSFLNYDSAVKCLRDALDARNLFV
ncbi:hypothetical protein RHMOL_Rhmol10G0252600 [Rhododendron molle]|uniref:Uncharacterized protein n=1 Tax=Rhododendron molle TaxID=49168 RepID=A0ACC0M5T0_RHOML|nr:hypothetical protein RHMOL_Rhmol10G0252600 [Rhododendron molle]